MIKVLLTCDQAIFFFLAGGKIRLIQLFVNPAKKKKKSPDRRLKYCKHYLLLVIWIVSMDSLEIYVLLQYWPNAIKKDCRARNIASV